MGNKTLRLYRDGFFRPDDRLYHLARMEWCSYFFWHIINFCHFIRPFAGPDDTVVSFVDQSRQDHRQGEHEYCFNCRLLSRGYSGCHCAQAVLENPAAALAAG